LSFTDADRERLFRNNVQSALQRFANEMVVRDWRSRDRNGIHLVNPANVRKARAPGFANAR
jgi:hypothetical protein